VLRRVLETRQRILRDASEGASEMHQTSSEGPSEEPQNAFRRASKSLRRPLEIPSEGPPEKPQSSPRNVRVLARGDLAYREAKQFSARKSVPENSLKVRTKNA